MYFAMLTLVRDPRFFERLPDDVIPEPNSCAVCGKPKGSGMWYSSYLRGYHDWIEPSDELRLARMKARRDITAAKSPLSVYK